MDEVITTRLKLRRWKESDLAAFAKITSDPRVCEFLLSPLTVEQSKALMEGIEKHIDQYGYGLWAVERLEDQALLGFTGLANVYFEAHFAPCVEIGWRLGSEYWGKGYAPEAAAASLNLAFEKFKLKEVVAFTVPDNLKSRRVMEKLGMTYFAEDDFDHPKVPDGHRLKRHVLYRITNTQWSHFNS